MFTDPNLTLADQIFWIVDVFLKDTGAGGLQAADRSGVGHDLEPGAAVRTAVFGAGRTVEGGDVAEGAGAVICGK